MSKNKQDKARLFTKIIAFILAIMMCLAVGTTLIYYLVNIIVYMFQKSFAFVAFPFEVVLELFVVVLLA